MSEERVGDPSPSGDSTAGGASRPVRGGPWPGGALGGTLFALAGGLLAWALIEAVYPVFSIPAELARITPSDSPETVQKREAARQKADLQNATFALACIGVLVGGSLGIGVGVARRSWTRLLAAGIACALVTGLFGALAGRVGHFTYLACQPESQPMPLTGTALVHAATLATLGLGVGLSLGPFMGRIRAAGECLLAGLAGGLLAAMVYPVLTGLLMPAAQTEWVVPVGAGSRVVWIGLTSGLLGLILAAFAGKRIHGGRRKPPDEQPPGRGTD